MRAYSKRFVSILTEVTTKRHLAGFVVLLLLAKTGMAAGADSSAIQWHPVKEITAAAENYVKLTIGSSDNRIVPTAGYLDPRLQLPRCTTALDPYLRPGTIVSGRTIVGVRCTGSRPWKVYLPVFVAVMETVLITGKSMPRGHLIQPDDIEIATRDVSGLVGGYLSQTNDILGQRMKRAVARGVVITPSLVEPSLAYAAPAPGPGKSICRCSLR